MDYHYIHYSCQQIDEGDIAAVTRVLQSDFLTQGPSIDAFEAALASCAKAPHAVALSSATAGLHLACLALGTGPGDTVWTSPISFVASSNAALYTGAGIDFVDVEPETGNMSMIALAEKLRATRTPPKAVIPVHYAGRACDMEALYALKAEYGFSIIEDCAHALGAKYANGTPIGSDNRSDAAVFSFHPVKPITTGEGGAVITHHAPIAQSVRTLRSHGITRDSAHMERRHMPAWYYEQQSLGFNYRMTDIQAALGVSQMKKLEGFIRMRLFFAERYPQLLSGLPLHLPPADAGSGWHLYGVRLHDAPRRDETFRKLRAANIGVNVHYMPIHLHPYYQKMGFAQGQFPQAETYFEGLLTIPLHPGLTPDDQDYVAQQLGRALA
ncbi:MAG: UDP-4-amino-4,6-dideoxy-N-acetyl-beta-L-altrosamine transaminase [Proteobacteria bacterium]|nr:UDP-4-amino-4,6-dideoxy-N-acetyl-beta-L-altrosamine transaminase [Pseudomonadota bacterium]